jgi:5'-3' exonuclease
VKIAILDGYNLMHRARFGMKGDNSIVFTFFRSLRPLVEKLSPDKIYLVLEGMPVHRQALDTEYKANRRVEEGTPQWDEMVEFRRQKKIIVDLLRYLPITVVRHPNFECDDVIASLVDQHAEDECTVVSTDTDFIQLLSRDNAHLYNPVRKEYIEGVLYDYVAWKALRGDKADNVPAVAGMTDKAAEKILANPEKLEEFLSVGDNRASYERNLQLIRLKIVNQEELEISPPEVSLDSLRRNLTSLRFFSMVNETAWKNYSKTFAPIYG